MDREIVLVNDHHLIKKSMFYYMILLLYIIVVEWYWLLNSREINCSLESSFSNVTAENTCAAPKDVCVCVCVCVQGGCCF